VKAIEPDNAVLSIVRDRDILRFTLKSSHTIEAQLAVSSTQVSQVIDEIGVTMDIPEQARGLGSHRQIETLPWDELVFCRGASALLPLAIQRGLAKLPSEDVRQLVIETDLLHVPWELFEIPSIVCKMCDTVIQEPPVCPHCRRLLLPDEFGQVDCVCGTPAHESLRTNCHTCDRDVSIRDLYSVPAFHLGQRFALGRRPKSSASSRADKQAIASPGSGPLRVLLVENPGGLSRTDEEVTSLLDFFRNNRHIIAATLLERENASPKSIRDQIANHGPFDIIHFIGHAEFVQHDPAESHLLLSHGDRVKLSDVPSVFGQFPARLVILNGCQTGMVASEEETQLGFPTAFLKLGCHGFVGTLARVYDRQAFHLSLNLYHELLQGTPLSDALLIAKQRMEKHEQVAGGGKWGAVYTRYAWAPFVAYGDPSLRLRSFDREVTWRDLAAAAQGTARSELARMRGAYHERTDEAPPPLPTGFLQNAEKPVWVALNTPPQGICALAEQMLSVDRHIVCLVDLARVKTDAHLSDYIGHDLLGREESLETLLPYIRQMTTSESALTLFVCGLDREAHLDRTLERLEQIEKLCVLSEGAIRVVLDGSTAIWAVLNALVSTHFLSLIVKHEELRSQTKGYALHSLRAWAEKLSEDELDSIAAEKWNRDTPDMYVRRIIEDEIAIFLGRTTADTRGFCVIGETGRGKTNLFCRLYMQQTQQQAEDRIRVPLFTTAGGLAEAAKGHGTIGHYFESQLARAALGDAYDVIDDRGERLERTFRVLREDAGGLPIELVVLIDAINELLPEETSSFVKQLTEWLSALCDDPVLRSGPVFWSVFVSSRAFSWRTFWHGREVEHRRYFGNVRLDENGELAENLFDFDPSVEARQAYELAGLKPEWSALDDDLRDLCRIPFILNILRSRASVAPSSQIKSYDDIMKYYESSVLLDRRSDAQALRTSGLREAVIKTMVKLLTTPPGKPVGRYLPEMVERDALCRELITQGYDKEETKNILYQLREESVLESRGGMVRFAFDRFFDYLFRNHLVGQAREGDWGSSDWLDVIARYHRSEYHRQGVSSALALEFRRLASAVQTANLVQVLLFEQDPVPPSHRQLVQEAMVVFGEMAPEKLAAVLAELHRHTQDILLVSGVACRVIASTRTNQHKKNALLSKLGAAVDAYLSRRSKDVESRVERRNLINILGGLGRAEAGIDLTIHLMCCVLGIEPVTQRLPDLLREYLEAFVDGKFQLLLGRIRDRALRHFRETYGRKRIILLVAGTALTTPGMLWFLARRPRLVFLLRHLSPVLQRLEFAIEVLVKSALLWVTERRSLSDAVFQQQLDAVDQFVFHGLLAPLVDAIQDEDRSNEYRKSIAENIAFLVGIVGLWPAIIRLFSYSEHGLDHLTELLQNGEGPALAEMLSLFDVTAGLSSVPDAIPKLRQLYLEPDAFRNYLGMLATIIQGTRDFSKVRELLWDVLTLETDRVIRAGLVRVPERAKLSREVFSIFTYMLRRTEAYNRQQLSEMITFVERVTEYLFDFDPREPELTDYLHAFLQTELFGHEDPFNPLLPLGVACQLSGRPYVGLEKSECSYISELISRLSQSSLPQRLALIDRVLRECVPMAYFAPLPVVATLADFVIMHNGLIREEPSVRKSITSVVRNLGYVGSGHSDRLFKNLESRVTALESSDMWMAQQVSELVHQIRQDAEGSRPDVAEVDYLYRSVDIFGGHDIVTTLFIEYPPVQKMLVTNLVENILRVQTASELAQGFLATIVEGLASPEINFSLLTLLFGGAPVEKEVDHAG
jgi:hypothetical protein